MQFFIDYWWVWLIIFVVFAISYIAARIYGEIDSQKPKAQSISVLMTLVGCIGCLINVGTILSGLMTIISFVLKMIQNGN